jgi:hypothetical protein
MPIRNTKGIFNNDTNYDIDASIIITAVVLGFCYTLLKDGKPVQFDEDPSYDLTYHNKLKDCIDRLNNILKMFDVKNKILCGKSLLYDKNKVISGIREQSKINIESRKNLIKSGKITPQKEMLNLALNDDLALGYRGVGAYTGCVVHNDNYVSFSSTARYIIPTDTTRGVRWNPLAMERNQPWGIIRGEPDGTMRSIGPVANATQIVGYTHGMIQGIYTSISRGNNSASIPFEIAVGSQTTKLASCLGCTLFMYSTNYIPSSMHLGLSASWAPLYPYHRTGGLLYKESYTDKAINIANELWDDACYEYLINGIDIIDLVQKKGLINPNIKYVKSITALKESRKESSTRYYASNLILDAFTVHRHASEHILNTLR